MDPTIYPDSHLSEEGKKQRSSMIKQLIQQAEKIKNERTISASNPSYLILRFTNSIDYHKAQLEEHLRIRDEHFKKVQEEYERKVKQTSQALVLAQERLKQETNKKSKPLMLAELSFDSLKEKYEKTFGTCPVKVVDSQESPLTQFSYTPAAPAPLPALPPAIPLPPDPTPPAPSVPQVVVSQVPDIKVVSTIPTSYMLTGDKENPFLTQEEVELAKLRAEARGVAYTPLVEKVNDTKSHLFHQQPDTKEVVNIPPPPKAKKPLIRPKIRPAEGTAGSQKYSIPLLPSQDDDD